MTNPFHAWRKPVHTCLCLLAAAAFSFPPVSTAAELAHPGFTATRGGAGGEVLRVTNLDADGPGSLRAALAAEGPRIIVFEVAGVIDLGMERLVIAQPFVTVAGQTAPSPGITIIKGGMSVQTHDVILQHLRVRPGDAGQPKKSGWEPDGIATSSARDVLVDHCSVTWAVDENLSASGPRTEGPEATSHRVTFSNNIIAEGLNDSSHAKGAHSMGSLIHDFCRDIAVLGNLYAHNRDRNPYFKAFTTGAIVNNVIYNPGYNAIKLNYSDGEWDDSEFDPENARVSVVGNVFLHGPNTDRRMALVGPRGDAFLADNQAWIAEGSPAVTIHGSVKRLDHKPVWPKELRALDSGETLDYVLANAGARPAERDVIDARIVQTVRERGGRIIDSQDEVGGYPEIEPVRRALDVPDEGVEAWLAELARKVE